MWRRALAPLREFGFVPGVTYLVDRSLRAISPRAGLYLYGLMVQPVNGPLLPARMAANVDFVEIGPDHPDIARMPAREEIKVSRFAQGARCLGVYRRGRLIGYIWFCFGSYEEDEVRCTYDLSKAEPAAWDFDLYLFPEHRMGTGFSAIWHGAFDYLRKHGIERSYSRVTEFNVASLRAHARLGARRVGRVLFVKLARLELTLSTLSPYIGVTLSSRVRLRLPLVVS